MNCLGGVEKWEYPVKSYGVCDGVKECSGNLITGYTAGVIQATGTIFGLIYGTRETAW